MKINQISRKVKYMDKVSLRVWYSKTKISFIELWTDAQRKSTLRVTKRRRKENNVILYNSWND